MELETLRCFGDELDSDYEATLKRFVALQVRGSANARATLGQLRSQLFARGWPARETLRAALALIASAAHAPFLSHPDEFFEALEGFVDGR